MWAVDLSQLRKQGILLAKHEHKNWQPMNRFYLVDIFFFVAFLCVI
jgi:hypothetical protein